MEFGPVTKRDKRNKATSKNFDDDVVSENCDVIAVFLMCGQFGIRKLDSGCKVCKNQIFIKSKLLSYKK